MITPFQLTQALRAMGVAEVFVGDPTVSGGMVSLGATEGEVRVEITDASNNLTAPEQTGNVPHQSTVTIDSALITVPLILGDPALWAKISSTGAKGGGHSIPQPVEETTVLVIPRSEVGGGLSYAAATWTRTAGNNVLGASGATAAPVNAFWLWRAYPMRGAVPFRYADGGKVIAEIRFQGMFDASKPEGQKVYTIGDPVAQGVTGILL